MVFDLSPRRFSDCRGYIRVYYLNGLEEYLGFPSLDPALRVTERARGLSHGYCRALAQSLFATPWPRSASSSVGCLIL